MSKLNVLSRSYGRSPDSYTTGTILFRIRPFVKLIIYIILIIGFTMFLHLVRDRLGVQSSELLENPFLDDIGNFLGPIMDAY